MHVSELYGLESQGAGRGESLKLNTESLQANCSLVDFPSLDGSGKVQQVVFRDVLDLKDQGGECGFQIFEGEILFPASGRRNHGAQFSYTLFR